MHKAESSLGNETQIILWDFEIRSNHTKLVKKKSGFCFEPPSQKNQLVNFAVPADYRIWIKANEKLHKYLDLARELKSMENEGENDTDYCWSLQKNTNKPCKTVCENFSKTCGKIKTN